MGYEPAVGNQYKAGANHGALTLFTAMNPTMNDPYAGPMDYSDPEEMADGSIRNLGWVQQPWHWDILSEAQANVVRALVGAANVYTLKNDGSLGEFTAVLQWPKKEPEHRSNKVLDLTVMLIKLVAYT